MCGKELFISIDEGRFVEHKRSVYNSDWQLTDIRLNSFDPIGQKEKPENFELMKSLVKKLSEGFDYIRIDLYSVKGKIYFGEFTHAPANGMEILQPYSADYEWGKLWKIGELNAKLYSSTPART